MKVLFTGHRGFLGREIIPELEKDCEIVLYQGDLRDFHALSEFVILNKVNRIIHAAVRGGRRTQVDTFHVLVENLQVGTNIIRLGLPTLAFCSGAIYGRQENIYLAKESSSASRYPTDFYGQSKFLFREIAKDYPNIHLVRFFNVFGVTETPERFLRANVVRHRNRTPIQVYQDFRMDFFYVKDSIDYLKAWLLDKSLPREINMVYVEKLFLSDLARIINYIGGYEVEILVESIEQGLDYCGDGSLLKSLNFDLKGLEFGVGKLMDVYHSSIAPNF